MGYYNINYFLFFYHNVCYYLKEVILAVKKPITLEKFFNFCYFSLQNIVEQIFRIIKRQFQIFKLVLDYSLDVQSSWIFIITALHNFI